MQRLWSPWRMEYVGNGPQLDESICLFCQAAADLDNPLYQVLHHDAHAFIIMNKYPYSNGHIMVVPKRHVPNLEELSAPEKMAIMDLLSKGASALKTVLNAHGLNAGFNLGQAAGAGIPGHLHMHLVPRWHNDSNFMTVLAEVRTIPEHLETTYQRLKTHFARLGA